MSGFLACNGFLSRLLTPSGTAAKFGFQRFTRCKIQDDGGGLHRRGKEEEVDEGQTDRWGNSPSYGWQGKPTLHPV